MILYTSIRKRLVMFTCILFKDSFIEDCSVTELHASLQPFLQHVVTPNVTDRRREVGVNDTTDCLLSKCKK